MFSHTKGLTEQAEKINGNLKDDKDFDEIKATDEVKNAEAVNDLNDAGTPPDDVESQLAEAEKRGFMRAMAMKAEELFNRPAPGTQTFPEPDVEESAASDVIVLSHIRRSVWD